MPNIWRGFTVTFCDALYCVQSDPDNRMYTLVTGSSKFWLTVQRVKFVSDKSRITRYDFPWRDYVTIVFYTARLVGIYRWTLCQPIRPFWQFSPVHRTESNVPTTRQSWRFTRLTTVSLTLTRCISNFMCFDSSMADYIANRQTQELRKIRFGKNSTRHVCRE